MPACVHALYRYPVKGLSPEPVARARLKAGAYFPGDRLFAIENGPSGFDPAAPEHQPKVRFLMLMRDERLATLRTAYDEATRTLTIRRPDGSSVTGDLSIPAGRHAVEAFFGGFMAADLRGPPRVLAAPDGYRFTDSRSGFVSIINLASVAAIEAAIGAPVDPLRFRGNLHVRDWPAWAEFDLLDREITVGTARLRVTRRIERCAATNVDPDLGVRDLNLPKALMRHFGHVDCGVYARVLDDGEIAPGDALQEAEPKLPLSS